MSHFFDSQCIRVTIEFTDHVLVIQDYLSGHLSCQKRTEEHHSLPDRVLKSVTAVAHIDLTVKSDPLIAVAKTDLLVGVVPCEPSLLGHPVTTEDELIQIGRYMNLMPYVPLAYRLP